MPLALLLSATGGGSYFDWTCPINEYISRIRLNFCDFGKWLTAKASGTAVIMGVSSFVAYRFLQKYLKHGVVQSLMEQLGFDPLIDVRRLRNESDQGFYAIRYEDEYNSGHQTIDRCLSAIETFQKQSSCSKDSQPRHVSAGFKRLTNCQHLSNRCKGIVEFGSLNINEENLFLNRDPPSSIVSRSSQAFRNDCDTESLSGFSDVTSASRIQPYKRRKNDKDPARIFCRQSCSFESDNSEVTIRSGHSAILQLNENELYWDNEFLRDNCCSEGPSFREDLSESCALSQLSAMQNLEQLFLERTQQEHECGFYDRRCSNKKQQSFTAADSICRLKSGFNAEMSSVLHSSSGHLLPSSDEGNEDELLVPEALLLSTNPSIYYRSVILQKSDADHSEAAASSTPNSSRFTTPHHRISDGNKSDLSKRVSTSINHFSKEISDLKPLNNSSVRKSEVSTAQKTSSVNNPSIQQEERIKGEMFDSVISGTSFSSSCVSASRADWKWRRRRVPLKQNTEKNEEGLWSLNDVSLNPQEERRHFLNLGEISGTTMFDSAIVSDSQSNGAGDEDSVVFNKHNRETFNAATDEIFKSYKESAIKWTEGKVYDEAKNSSNREEDANSFVAPSLEWF